MPTPVFLWLIIALERNTDKIYKLSELPHNYAAEKRNVMEQIQTELTSIILWNFDNYSGLTFESEVWEMWTEMICLYITMQ